MAVSVGQRLGLSPDEVEDIRTFAVATQRAAESIDAVEIYPAREVRIDDELAKRAAALATAEEFDESIGLPDVGELNALGDEVLAATEETCDTEIGRAHV